MLKNGQKPNFRLVKGGEFYSLLREKLSEEIGEFFAATSKEEMVAEMGDVVEVLISMAEYNGLSWDEVEEGRKLKKEERGGFDGGVVLEIEDV